jgi:hypothetical protein
MMFKLTAVLVLSITATAAAAPALSDWSTAQKIDEDRRQQLRARHDLP